MSTTPRVTVPEHAVDEHGAIAMSEVIATHAPALAAARRGFFDTLLPLVEAEPVAHELLRLATAELSGCRLCRNQRSAAAAEAGVDEDVIASTRARRYEELGARERVALELGDRFRAHPGDLDHAAEPEPAPELAVLGAASATAMVLTTGRALADGKAIVALGLEPEGYTVQEPS